MKPVGGDAGVDSPTSDEARPAGPVHAEQAIQIRIYVGVASDAVHVPLVTGFRSPQRFLLPEEALKMSLRRGMTPVGLCRARR